MFKGCKICFTCHNSWMAKKSEGFKVFTCVTSSKAVPTGGMFLKRMPYTQKSTDVSSLVKCSCQELFHIFLQCDNQPRFKEVWLETTASKVWGEEAWSSSLGLDTTSQIHKMRETSIFACGYYGHISSAGDILGDSLCWNSGSLTPVHASGMDGYWLVPGNLRRPNIWDTDAEGKLQPDNWLHGSTFKSGIYFQPRVCPTKHSAVKSKFLKITFWYYYGICTM